MKRFFPMVIVLAALAAACAGPVTKPPMASYTALKSEIRHETGEILEKYVAARQRLLVAAMPLMLENAALCPRRALTPGFLVHSDFDLPDALRDVAHEKLGLGAEAVVLSVFPHTAAWHEGLRPGDTVLSFNGKPVRNAAELRARIRKIKKPITGTFGFVRQGRAFSLALPFVETCNYPVIYQDSNPVLNAYTDGKKIFMTQRMVDFATDSELEVVIGHELAHAIMHHVAKDTYNTLGIEIAGGIVDGLFGIGVRDLMLDAYTRAFSSRFEQEADYVGLYLLARAGGNVTAAAPFWRKMAAEQGMGGVIQPLHLLHTHPSAPERFAVLKAAEQEIAGKQRKNLPLMPEMASRWNFGQRYSWWSDNTDTDDEPEEKDLND